MTSNTSFPLGAQAPQDTLDAYAAGLSDAELGVPDFEFWARQRSPQGGLLSVYMDAFYIGREAIEEPSMERLVYA